MSNSNIGKVCERHLSTPRQRLAWVRERTFGRRGQAALAKALGVPPTTYAHYEKDVDPPLELALKLVRTTRVNPRWLWHGHGAPFLPLDVSIPEESDVAAAIGELLEETESLENALAEPEAQYKTSPKAPPRTWADFLKEMGVANGEMLRLDEAPASWITGGLVGVDRDGAKPEFYRGAQQTPVAFREPDGALSCRLISETDEGLAMVPDPDRPNRETVTWRFESSQPFPVLGRIVFLFADAR